MIPIGAVSSWGTPAPAPAKNSRNPDPSSTPKKNTGSRRNRSILNSFSAATERRDYSPWPRIQPVQQPTRPHISPFRIASNIRIGYPSAPKPGRFKPKRTSVLVIEGEAIRIKSSNSPSSAKHIQYLETIPEFNGAECCEPLEPDFAALPPFKKAELEKDHSFLLSSLDSSSLRSLASTETGSCQSSDLNLSLQTTHETMAEGERAPTSHGMNSYGNVQREAGGLAPAPSSHQTPPPGSRDTPPASTNLSGLVCNVHRTTGKQPHPLVGATTNILGDKLYVFGGRSLSRTKPQLTSDIYELDLISRHWTKIDVKGDIPPPRYFHSVCTLGDTKLVCYGGMSPIILPPGQSAPPSQTGGDESTGEVAVMSDIHIYDVNTRTWTAVNCSEVPKGRYAHCATILPSSGVWASSNAPLSALHHNPSTGSNPNQGSIGVSIEGTGGAEMIVVGGQDSGNHYIDQISVFNLRNLKWTSTTSLGKSCGAYRSVVSPLLGLSASRIGRGTETKNKMNGATVNGDDGHNPPEKGISMLIYSNYNFLDVKLELQIRAPDGSLTEKPMNGQFSPPGLRFPNGGVIDSHFVVSGTYLTSSKQEYALWALDLRTLTWSRIDAGGNVFSQGSWNRGILWTRRNTFVILGNRKRSLVDDYNHRRINFSNVCMVELEAFGLYDNPRRVAPMSAYVSASSPFPAPYLPTKPSAGGGRVHTQAAEDLGRLALGLKELCDMDLLAVGGERVPVNSRVVSRRWGPYFNQLLQEGALAAQDTGDTATLRPFHAGGSGGASLNSRNSSITITPSIGAASNLSGTTKTSSGEGPLPPSTADSSAVPAALTNGNHTAPSPTDPPDPRTLPPNIRLRTLYLPHTHLTLQALTYYLYTSSLPPLSHPLCTPQILCSLLQLARPYMVDGLAEACVERLHQVLDGRNAVAVFNAAAMAAGGGQALLADAGAAPPPTTGTRSSDKDTTIDPNDASAAAAGEQMRQMRIDAAVAAEVLQRGVVSTSDRDDEEDGGGGSSAASTATSFATDDESTGGESGNEAPGGGARRAAGAGAGGDAVDRKDVKWEGQLSVVVGLQKRGLRGLMEGRRLRERGRGGTPGREGPPGQGGAGAAGGGGHPGMGSSSVGLGIA